MIIHREDEQKEEKDPGFTRKSEWLRHPKIHNPQSLLAR